VDAEVRGGTRRSALITILRSSRAVQRHAGRAS
jgi:hypothetical protein